MKLNEKCFYKIFMSATLTFLPQSKTWLRSYSIFSTLSKTTIQKKQGSFALNLSSTSATTAPNNINIDRKCFTNSSDKAKKLITKLLMLANLWSLN